MQAIELRPVGLDGSKCRSGEAPGPILVEIIGRVVPARCRSLLLASRPGTSARGLRDFRRLGVAGEGV